MAGRSKHVARQDSDRSVPGTIWITGLSAAGKSTLGSALGKALLAEGHPCSLLDGEVLRRRMTRAYGHSLDERFAVLREIVGFAAEVRQQGRIPIVATISHKREMRAFAREALSPMLEVYLDCAASVCAARDRKGHYRLAMAGQYECFVGVTEPYETWDRADVVIDTARMDKAEAGEILRRAALAFLRGSDPAG